MSVYSLPHAALALLILSTVTLPLSATVTPFSHGEFQTVSGNGDFPADIDNNIDKFDTAGTEAKFIAPFTTTQYLRTSAINADRSTQLFLQFDLSTLDPTLNIISATLEFDAYSLNDKGENDVDLMIGQIADDWAPGGAPDPDPIFNAALVGDAINAGSVVSGTETDLYDSGLATSGSPVYRNTASYVIDVAPIARNWKDGDPNHGFHLQLTDSVTLNNGIGIDPTTLVLNMDLVSNPLSLLSTASPDLTGSYTVSIEFTEAVTGLTEGDFEITNGTASSLDGTGATYTIDITPTDLNMNVTVSLPADSANAIDNGDGNIASNLLVSSPVFDLGNMRNNDLNTLIPVLAGTTDSSIEFSFNSLTNSVLYGGTDTGIEENQWILPSSIPGFGYDQDGGAGGVGDGIFFGTDSVGMPFDQSPVAVFHFVDDDKQSTGTLNFGLDVFLDDNTGGNALQLLVELYAWNDGDLEPLLSAGGPTANDPTYHLTDLGNAVTVLNTQILASSVASAAWQTVSLGSFDVGDGYDNYAWRIGVLGATPTDISAFDNITVATGTINISDIQVAANGDVTIDFTSPSGNVDIYRSTDLQSWGTAIDTDIAPGSYLDNTAAALSEAFYVLVPTGVSFP